MLLKGRRVPQFFSVIYFYRTETLFLLHHAQYSERVPGLAYLSIADVATAWSSF
jgi:hypothetical protein